MLDEDEVNCFLTYFFPEEMDFLMVCGVLRSFRLRLSVRIFREMLISYDRTSVLADEAVQLILLCFIKCWIT